MFTPVLPGNSLTSWLYLQKHKDEQIAAFGKGATVARESSRFTQQIGGMGSVSDLMNDYSSLKVALGAYGLQDDLPNRYFVRQVIEQGTEDDDAFANRLSDSRYTALAKGFETLGLTGSGDLRTSSSAIDADLAAAVKKAQGDSPLYLNAAARISAAYQTGMDAADTPAKAWERAADDAALAPALRKILGVSANAATLDAAGQAAILKDATNYVFGKTTLSTLIDPDNAYDVADTYLGTSGQSLDTAFSYGGLAVRVAAVFSGQTSDAARWQALQADTALRDVVAKGLGVTADLDTMSASVQISTLQAAAQTKFGRSDFGLFSSQANLTEIGDRNLALAGTSLSEAFTLGGFTEAVLTVVNTPPTAEESWSALLGNEEMAEALQVAYDLGDGFADLDEADQIDALKAATLARFGSEDPAVLADPKAMAEFSGLYMDVRISDITSRYVEQEYRVAIGEQRPELRVALSLAEEMQAAADTGGTENGRWFRVLGSSVLREAFETAFNLGSQFAQLDLDAQVSTLKKKADELIGSDKMTDFLDPANQEALLTRYLARANSTGTVSSPSLSLFGDASSASILATLYGL